MDIFCAEMTKNESWLLKELKAEKYDVGITEKVGCMFGIFEAVGIKTKILSSNIPLEDWVAQMFGIPLPRSYMPLTFDALVTAPKMSYMEKLINLYHSFHIDPFPFKNSNFILHKSFGEKFPDLNDIMLKIPFVFVNMHEFLDHLKPTSSKIINIGGLCLKSPKNLVETLLPIFEKAKKGVVLFSFGSVTNTDVMPRAYLHAYLKAFAKFPDYEFIWKFNLRPEEKDLFSKYPNVHPVNWLDQTSILAHPKTKAFMTHAGMNSFIEGTYSGVPFIATPLFGDQNYNTGIIRNKEIGVYLDIKKVTVDLVVEVLSEVLEKEKYHNNAQKLKKNLETFPYTPAERLVKFVEYAAANTIEDELNLPGANMTFIEYFCLDVIIPPAIGLLILVYVLYRVLRRSIGFVFSTFGMDSRKIKVD